jgi:hypothetical protein
MTRTRVAVDDRIPPRETVSRIAAGASADDRARALRWLQDNAERFLDFEVLEHRERSGL